MARDGFAPFIIGMLPKNTKRRRPLPIGICDLFYSKLRKFIIQKYIDRESTLHRIVSKVDYFPVPKGDGDIRPVFNGTSCGLNSQLWAPNFYLPSADSNAATLTFNYQSIDMDFGEMLINFPLHPSLQTVSGLDLSPFTSQISSEFPEHIIGAK